MNRPSSREVGRQTEDAALAHLERHGLVLVARNYTCRRGEVDLICLDRTTLVFVEVRFRRTNARVPATESIGASKQRRLCLAAEHFLATHREHATRLCRFDVVAVSAPRGSIPKRTMMRATGTNRERETEMRIDWIQDAFQA